MFETLETSVEDTIGRLTLNRPQRLNALCLQLLKELADAAEWFNQQPSVRAVIVTGKGRAFCAGADLEGFPQPGEVNARNAADAGRIMADADGLLASLMDPECIAAREAYIQSRLGKR